MGPVWLPPRCDHHLPSCDLAVCLRIDIVG